MPDTHSDIQSLITAIGTDVTRSVELYFAPVKAVVKEFNKAISCPSRASRSDAPKPVRAPNAE